MDRLRRAFCSTSRTPTPVSRTRASDWNSSWASSGERPSEGSSSSRYSGADIMARPMATICCSPPLIVRAAWAKRSLRRGKRSTTMSRLRFSAWRARRAKAPSVEVLAHRQVAEDAAALRHQRDARLDDFVRRQVADFAAAERDRAAGQVRHDAGDDLEQGPLAGAVGAEDGDHLAAVDVQVDVVERDMLAVGGGDVGDPKQRHPQCRRRPPPARPARRPAVRRRSSGRRSSPRSGRTASGWRP